MRIELKDRQLTLREAEPADEPALLALFEACEDYFEAVTGLPPAPGDVQSLFYSLPEGADWQDKHVLVLEAAGQLIGVVDAVLRYPDQHSCAIGLFLLHPDQRRKGLGSALTAALLKRAVEEGVTRVTATVPAGWAPGERFLAAQAFTLTDHVDVRTEIGNRRAGPRERGTKRAELRLPAGFDPF